MCKFTFSLLVRNNLETMSDYGDYNADPNYNYPDYDDPPNMEITDADPQYSHDPGHHDPPHPESTDAHHPSFLEQLENEVEHVIIKKASTEGVNSFIKTLSLVTKAAFSSDRASLSNNASGHSCNSPESIETVIGKEWYFYNKRVTSFMGVDRSEPTFFVFPLEKEKAKSPKFLVEWVDPVAKKYVTIAYTATPGQKKYITCRRKGPFGGAMAEFRTEIGDFEKFKIHFCTTAESFFFLSHNNLYLHYSGT